MTSDDLMAYRRLTATKRFASTESVLLVSPNYEQVQIWREAAPRAWLFCTSKTDWDLNECRPWHVEVIFLANVMHYSPDPGLWIRNLAASCRTLVIQDLIEHRRGEPPGYLGADNDMMRYSFSDIGRISRFESAFDLSTLARRRTYLDVYISEGWATNFCVVFDGDDSADRLDAPLGLHLASAWNLSIVWVKYMLRRAKSATRT